MAAAKVQEFAWTNVSTGTPRTGNIGVTGVTVGNDLIVTIIQSISSIRTYTVTGSVDGAFSSVVSYNPGLGVHIYRLKNVSVASQTITVTANTGTTNFQFTVDEFSGLHQSASAITGTFLDGADSNTHYSAAVGSIDITDAGLVWSVGSLNSVSGVTSTTADTGNGFAKRSTALPSNQFFVQYKIATAAENDLRGQWTSGGTARSATSCMAWIQEAPNPYVPIVQLNAYRERGINGRLN